MTAFGDMAQPSPLFRQHEYEWRGKRHNMLCFTCPGCGEAHQIDAEQWTFNGDYDRPSFEPSYLTWNDPNPRASEGSKYRSGWRCHSFIRDGQIQFLSDCTHALAGQTVAMVPFDLERIIAR